MEIAIEDQRHLAFGLRDLIWLVALSGIAIASFTAGRWAAWAGVFVFGSLFVSRVIAIFVGRGFVRAAAAGFLIPATIYLGVTILISENEYSYAQGVLPTSQITQHQVEKEYATVGGKASLPGKNLTKELTRMAIPRLAFMHLFIACLAGFVGGRYATWVHSRSRTKA